MMERIRITGWAVGLLLVTAGAAAGQETAGTVGGAQVRLTVEDAIEQALAENEQTRIARAAVDRTRGLVREAFADALPTIDGSYQLAHNLQRPVIFFNQARDVTMSAYPLNWTVGQNPRAAEFVAKELARLSAQ